MKKVLAALVTVAIIVIAALVYYILSLSGLVESRFAGRRWQIPSRVYSDSMLLFPGQQIDRSSFFAKLKRLHYRLVDGFPKYKGEMRRTSAMLDIYLHDAKLQNRQRSGFPLRIRFEGDRIQSIKDLETNKMIPIFELEPEELTLFFGPERERRQLVSIQQVPDHLIKAVMAIEDNRFYKHYGVSFTGILRAFYMNVRHGKIMQGASTITQQLAKNYFLSSRRTFTRKAKEVLIALIIESRFSKKEILEIYFNEIYLGQRGSESINGIGEASFFYFGKPTDALSLEESATIAGLIKGPNLYSPYINPDICRKRRDTVLRAMRRNGWISRSEMDQAIAKPLKVAGYTAHPRRAPYFVDYLYQQLTRFYSKKDLSSLGLSIYTTLDPQVQSAAEKALQKGLRELENRNPSLKRNDPVKQLQGAIVVIQPKTGNIMAMVGGRNYSYSQFNRITQAKRQTGSAFKPFVCLAALDRFTPASIFSNKDKAYPTEDGGMWIPQNFEADAPERASMRTALARSYNRATVDMATQTGLEKIVAQARRLGFSTPLAAYPSLALGAFEAIPLELARAYCVFAADGVMPYPMALKNITDASGKTLKRKHIRIEQVTTPAKAYILSSMLRSTVVEGTAKSLVDYGIHFPVAGKTGTTNNFRDAWFVGYTPDILALVWVGFDETGSTKATGARAALPIWAELMKAIPHQLSGSWFTMPPGVVKEKICPDSGMRPKALACPVPMEEVFLSKKVPEEYCTFHKLKIIDKLMEGIESLVQ